MSTPADLIPLCEMPGGSICNSCRVGAGVAVGVFEAYLLWKVGTALAWMLDLKPLAKKQKLRFTPLPPFCNPVVLANLSLLVFGVVGIVGLLYYGLIVAIMWNFISWLFLSGILLVGPAVWASLKPEKPEEDESTSFHQIDMKSRPVTASPLKINYKFWRAFFCSGWFLGLITYLCFNNYERVLTTEIQRRGPDRNNLMITPTAASVLAYRAEFLHANPPNIFFSLDFHDAMDVVDVYVRETIHWREDYGSWKMVGTYLTPDEVLHDRAGDCEGQAVVTASLLKSLANYYGETAGSESKVNMYKFREFSPNNAIWNAWIVETPFHFWTLAKDMRTGENHYLNAHGSAGLLGSVEPQTPVMVFTNDPPGYNISGTLYVAPPLEAFASSWTGMHELVRDFLPGVTLQKMLIYGGIIGVLLAVFSTIVYGKISLDAAILAVQRLVISLLFCEAILLSFWWWIIQMYPVSYFHMAFTLSTTLYLLVSNKHLNPQ